MNSNHLAILRYIDRLIFENYLTSKQSLAIFRVIYALVMLGCIPHRLRLEWLSEVPDAFFSPPIGPAAFFTKLPSATLILSLYILLNLGLILLLMGCLTRLASLLTAFCVLSLNMWSYSLGKINHDLMLALVPLVFMFSGWGESFSIDARYVSREPVVDPENRRNSWTVSLFALLIGLAMLTAAIPKIRTGWLDLSNSATFGHFLQNFYGIGRRTIVSQWLLGHYSPWTWEFQDWAAVIFEAGFILAWAHRKSFRIFCAVGGVFHLMVMVTFGICFWFNVLAYSCFVDWSSLLQRLVRFIPTAITSEMKNTSGWLLIMTTGTMAILSIVSNLLPFDLIGMGVVILGGVAGTGYLIYLPISFLRVKLIRGTKVAH